MIIIFFSSGRGVQSTSWDGEAGYRVHVSDLAAGVSRKEIERAFGKYGSIHEVCFRFEEEGDSTIRRPKVFSGNIFSLQLLLVGDQSDSEFTCTYGIAVYKLQEPMLLVCYLTGESRQTPVSVLFKVIVCLMTLRFEQNTLFVHTEQRKHSALGEVFRFNFE